MKPDLSLISRVLLVNFNTYDQPYPVYPIGLAYIEGALREDGHETEIWDMVPPGESLEAAVRRFQPDFIGISMRNIDNAQSHNPRSFTLDLLACVTQLRAVSAALPNALYFATIGMRVYPGTPLWQVATQHEPAGEGADHLFEPLFYLEPPLTVTGIHTRLRQVQQSASNWAVGDPPPAFIETMAKLRRRGKGANMWEYVELMQRLGSGLQGTSPAAPTHPQATP